MRSEVPAFDVMDQIFWLGATPSPADAEMRRIADCVAAIRPGIAAASREFGDGRTMWSLLAILVHMARECGNSATVVAMMRTNARIIELEDCTGTPWSGCLHRKEKGPPNV